ncbi:kinesin-like protein KIF28P [Xenia sp. Carnegie-2017]|uniref:kinesin-like protein KIF28P n=1 Tax=Xenia sp. Carnegie-2017 TaxID=2897299 RepID=UPI001F03C61E|nr:kinesin-like protein KIF28P [Xenia sp. Carnegie-2017]
MAESVKVAVRVRPFNTREKDRNAKCCIDMPNKTMTRIKDPDNPDQPPKEFTFDFSYWSHDGYEVNSEGLCVPTDAKYADQRTVFDDLGQGVLNNAFKGFNCSLFAYGQTGAGKSYSMVGYGPNKGIVPITCDELFKSITENQDKANTRYEVTFSMLEIYNEQVRDLLTKDNPKGGLQVRQNPKLGSFFVQGLKKVAVGSYKEIEKRTEEGTSNRTVAATQMNATSSRAHTVVTVTFDQISKNDSGQETKKSSTINLVDLAGSERADSTGATGDRLKEGANINKSLSALGNVISALADLSMGKKKIMVPYRDSVLTKLLQNALGGNSKTIMIAALSPADINYDETLSTLRYADRAKKIKNKAVVNENPMDKLIRELREENEKLKKFLDGGGATIQDVSGRGAAMSAEEKEKMRKEMEAEIRAQLAANQEAMQSWDEKLEKSRSEEVNDSSQSKIADIPHLVNLNEDPMLSGVVRHFLEGDEITVGRKDADPAPIITLSGLSIQKQHAIITVKNGEITVKPAAQGAKTKVNGMPLPGERVLKHLDRVLFGSNHLYYLVNPKNTEKSEGSPDEVDWNYAQKEMAEATGFQTGFGTGLSKEQQLAQEQVLELLPLVGEANAVSEELDKHKNFELVLISGAAQGNLTGSTKVMVKMTDLLNGNSWLWDRGKFMNRRYLMQDLYQRYLDGDSTVANIPQEEDPFWEPLEDVLVGTANVFLQSLAYALDFDDKLSVTDYKGGEQASMYVNVTPCNQNGKSLDEDYFVDDSKELLGKPYHYKVTIRTAEVRNSRFSKGLYVKYKTFDQTEEFTKSPVVKDSLSPEFNHSTIFSFPAIRDEHLEWFENGCITLMLYAIQKESLADSRLSKMTTKELRQMDQYKRTDRNPSLRRSVSMKVETNEISQLKSEIILLKRQNERLLKKEKRLQSLCEEWAKKPSPEQDFAAFHRQVSAAAYHQSGRLKYRVHMLQALLKAQPAIEANGQAKLDEPKKGGAGSRACSVM